MDLTIALGGGQPAPVPMILPRLSVAFVGVAIATALVPPLSASAICLARGDYALASGALLLPSPNIVGIQVAGSVVMWLGGYRGGPQTTRAGSLEADIRGIRAQHFEYCSRHAYGRVSDGSEISPKSRPETRRGDLPHSNSLHAARGWRHRTETAAGRGRSGTPNSPDSRNGFVKSGLSLLQQRSE
jgi:hypothetical protein